MDDSKLALQYVLISSQTSDPYSTRLLHPQTGVSVWSYKGSEYQSGLPSLFEPIGIQGDFFLAAIKNQPLLHLIGFNAKKRFHTKSVIAGNVTAACTDPSGCFLFAAIEEKIYVWSIATRELINVFNAHFLKITAMKMSDDGAFLVSGSEDGSISVFHIKSVVGLKMPGSEKVEPYHSYSFHNTAVSDIYITPGQQPRILSVGGQTAILYSLSSQSKLLSITVDYPLTSCTMDAGEFRIYMGSSNGSIRFVNLHVHTFQPDELFDEAKNSNVYKIFTDKHKAAITKLSVSSDGTLLVSGDASGKYVFWNLKGGTYFHEGTFNGPIINVKFVKPWPSIMDESYVAPPSLNTPFHKQINTQQMELMVIKDQDDKCLDKKIQNLLQNYITKSMKENRELPPPPPAVVAVAAALVKPEVENGLDDDEKDRTIEKLQEEIKILQEANAELYKMCRDMIVDEREEEA